MNTYADALRQIGLQLTHHAQATGRGSPMDQITYGLCEDHETVVMDVYLEDGFNATATYTPAHRALPRNWQR